MTEWDEHDLALLAPEVDQGRSRALFDKRRTRRRTRRRAGAMLALALLAVAGFGGYAWIERSGTVAVETGVADQPTESASDLPDFEVLDVRTARDPMGMLRAAVDPTQLDTLWATVGYDDTPPDVNFEQWVLVTITIPDDACPPTLTGFDRAGETLTPVFVEPTSCRQPLIPKTFVVTIKRSTVTPSFTLRLPPPDTPSYGYGEQLLSVEVPVVGAPPVPQVDLSSAPCTRQDGAEVCLEATGTSVEVRASGLQPGSTLTLTGDDGLPMTYPIGSEGRPDGVIAFVTAFPEQSRLRLAVTGTTSAGNALVGTVSTG